MAITRFKDSSIVNRGPKYDSMLAGLPYRPVIGTATDGGNGTSVSVAFTGNNVAGAGVTYTALSTPGNLTATGPASPITVTGLTSGTEYTFQVKAGNSLGDSAYSAASNSVTPVTPTAFESIATTTLSTATSTVTFGSIPQTYQHLQIRFLARLSQATTGFNDLRLYVNGASSSYAWHRLSGDGASASAAGLTADNGVYGKALLPRDSNTANIFGVGIIDLLDYTSASKNPTIKFFAGTDLNGSGIVYLGSGIRTTAEATTSFTLNGAGWSFVSGSTFALYGIKGA